MSIVKKLNTYISLAKTKEFRELFEESVSKREMDMDKIIDFINKSVISSTSICKSLKIIKSKFGEFGKFIENHKNPDDNKEKIEKLLKTYQYLVAIKASNNISPIHCAAKNGYQDIIEIMLLNADSAKVNRSIILNQKDGFYRNALYCAAKKWIFGFSKIPYITIYRY